MLDPANYGSLTITNAVSIEGHGWASIAPVSGGNAITVNAGPTDKINIIGVVLDGTAVANATGIQFNTGAELHIVDCVVRNFMGSESPLCPRCLALWRYRTRSLLPMDFRVSSSHLRPPI